MSCWLFQKNVLPCELAEAETDCHPTDYRFSCGVKLTYHFLQPFKTRPQIIPFANLSGSKLKAVFYFSISYFVCTGFYYVNKMNKVKGQNKTKKDKEKINIF